MASWPVYLSLLQHTKMGSFRKMNSQCAQPISAAAYLQRPRCGSILRNEPIYRPRTRAFIVGEHSYDGSGFAQISNVESSFAVDVWVALDARYGLERKCYAQNELFAFFGPSCENATACSHCMIPASSAVDCMKRFVEGTECPSGSTSRVARA